MDVLKKLFNESVSQQSPVQTDYVRTVVYDSEGNQKVTYEKTDYLSIQKSHGKLSDWSLNALLKSGINPNFPIHTGMPTRVEGVGILNEASAVAEGLLVPETPETSETPETE